MHIRVRESSLRIPKLRRPHRDRAFLLRRHGWERDLGLAITAWNCALAGPGEEVGAFVRCEDGVRGVAEELFREGRRVHGRKIGSLRLGGAFCAGSGVLEGGKGAEGQ